MANDYQSNINNKLLKQFLPAWESNTILAQTVSKQLVNDYDPSTGSAGDAVSMKRDTQYTPQRSADGDMTSAQKNPIRTGKVSGEVGQYITVIVENTQVEEALQTDQLPKLMSSITEDMAVTLESELALYMAKNAALTSGTPDNAISAWSDIANAGALFKELGAPTGRKYACINSFDEVKLADLQTKLGVNPEVGSAWNSSKIRSNFAGFDDVMTSNNLPEYSSGTSTGMTLAATPTATYTSVKDTYQMTLSVSGGGANATIKAGQGIRFATRFLTNFRNHKVVRKNGAGVPLTLTVLEDVTLDGTGAGSIKVSGAAINEAGVLAAYNTVETALTSGDTITILETASKTYRPGLAYCEGFVGMGSVVLPKLHATDSMVMNHKGLSIRVHRFSDGIGNKNQYRFDLLPTFACFNPFYGQKLFGA